jgi:hypothetical protein
MQHANKTKRESDECSTHDQFFTDTQSVLMKAYLVDRFEKHIAFLTFLSFIEPAEGVPQEPR